MKIAIIGAGISGLYLGNKLKNKGYDFDIYEKNNIIGGRIKTVDFDGNDVIAGAGILTLKKDKRMIELCKEFKVDITPYKSNISYTFVPFDILKVVEKLKENLDIITKENERYKYTFSKFAKMILGEKDYNKFILSVGFSDFEKADVIDTLYNYGFDEYVSGVENLYVIWNQLLENMYTVLRSNIYLSTPIKKINVTDDKKFIIKNKVYDKVVFASNIETIRYFLKNSIYKDIRSQTFVRLYVKLNKNIPDCESFIVTSKPFQKIIRINKEKCIYMISYSDNKIANKWKQVDIKKTVKRGLKTIFNEDIKVLKQKIIFWKIGTHYYKPLSRQFTSRKDFIEIAQNPHQNMYVIGDAVSMRQGNCEGAVDSVELIYNKIIN
jgi:hypothetical protein